MSRPDPAYTGNLRKIDYGDLPHNQVEQIDQLLMCHSTPLGLNGEFAGSGTYIKCNETYGILTARHVIERFDFSINSKQVLSVSVMDRRPHSYPLPMRTLRCVRIGRPKKSNCRAGPDLAVIVLPNMVGKNIGNRKSFHDLFVHHHEKLEETRYFTGIWCAFGFPEEYVHVSATNKKSKMSRCLSLRVMTTIVRRRGSGGFDYLHLAVNPEKLHGNAPPPRKYNGMSGSGVWRIPIVEDDKGCARIQLEKALLAGVVFFETRQSGQSKELRCHGPKSLYLKVRRALIRAATPRD